MEAAKAKKGSGEPNRKKVATVTWDQVKLIAEDKMPDLNAFTRRVCYENGSGYGTFDGIQIQEKLPFNF